MMTAADDIRAAVAELFKAKGPQQRRGCAVQINRACQRAHITTRECVAVIKSALPPDMPAPQKGMICGWIMGAECAAKEFGARSMVGQSLLEALDYLAGRLVCNGEPTHGEDVGVAEQRVMAALHDAATRLGEARARVMLREELKDLLEMFDATLKSVTMRKGMGEK